MNWTLAGLIGAAIGLIFGGLGAVFWYRLRGDLTPRHRADVADLPDGVLDVLAVLQSITIVLDSSDAVVYCSQAAIRYGLVRRGELAKSQLRDLVRQVRRDAVVHEVDLELVSGVGPTSSAVMGVRVAPLGNSHILVLAEDRTRARRVEEVRRDFVANVSHELKTPVGGIALLAEAVLDARDDPVAVSRFAERIQVESTRLTSLVREIVDLSRLQVADTLHEPDLVDICAVIRESSDRLRVTADARKIAIHAVCEPGLQVFGDAELLTTAVANLMSNAINHSEAGTRVGVAARRVDDTAEITVSDQGPGIAPSELGRIFERFYRVDAARSRATGGTGLGLAIVKHVCSTHGGDVSVWSKEGHGSTFTIRVPVASDRAPRSPDRLAVGSTIGDPNP